MNFISASVPPEETTTSISFEQWLASVTERINQTMHYQFSGMSLKYDNKYYSELQSCKI